MWAIALAFRANERIGRSHGLAVGNQLSQSVTNYTVVHNHCTINTVNSNMTTVISLRSFNVNLTVCLQYFGIVTSMSIPTVSKVCSKLHWPVIGLYHCPRILARHFITWPRHRNLSQNDHLSHDEAVVQCTGTTVVTSVTLYQNYFLVYEHITRRKKHTWITVYK